MTAPWWLTDGLAAFMVVIAAYCAIRPAAARRWRRSTEPDVDAAHVLMGVAMAATLIPRLDPIRNGVWAVAIAVAGGWFAVRAVQDRRQRLFSRAGSPRPASSQRAPDAGAGHHVVHLLSCGSMLYMLLAASAVGASTSVMSTTLARPAVAADSTASAPGISALIALVLAVAMTCSVIVTTDRLAVLTPAHLTPVGQVPARLDRARVVPARVVPARVVPARLVPARLVPARVVPARLAPARVRHGRPADRTQRDDRSILCPRLAAACRIAMGVTMVYVLVQML